eukprot:6109965-Alexandrium_andersonii.AAC.1
MSASLVGSEMCIRDRVFDGGRPRSMNKDSVTLTQLSFVCAYRAYWGSSVSYTHLTLPTICSV